MNDRMEELEKEAMPENNPLLDPAKPAARFAILDTETGRQTSIPDGIGFIELGRLLDGMK